MVRVTVTVQTPTLDAIADRRWVKTTLSQVAKDGVMLAKALAPVRTGTLRDSISSRVRGNTITFIANAPYSGFVEFGHKMVILPVRRRALRFVVDGVVVFAKKVVQRPAGWIVVGNKIMRPFLFPAIVSAINRAMLKLAEVLGL